MNIVLIGFMCSGKSTVGRLLSQKLDRRHIDTDQFIEQREGRTIAEIMSTEGEERFREIERQAVQEIARSKDAVISTGGGVPADPVNWDALSNNGRIFWLKVAPETVLRRAGNLKTRPLIDPAHPLDSIRKRLAEREPIYAQAHHVISSDNFSSTEAANQIAELMMEPK